MIRIALFLATAAVLGLAAHLPRGASEGQALGGNLGLKPARSFPGFPVYYLGESYAGLRLRRIYRIDAPAYPGEDVRRDDVTFVYGDCRPHHGGGCLPPLQVQSWSACERHLAAYAYEPEAVSRIGGRTARTFEGGRRIEIAAGPTTVVLYAANASRLRRAAAALRVVNPGAEVRACS